MYALCTYAASQARGRVVRVATDRKLNSKRTPHVDALVQALKANAVNVPPMMATGTMLRELYSFNIES
jgi:hypothetical protein